MSDYFDCNFPVRAGWQLTYEVYVQLVLHTDRILVRRAVSTLAAISAAWAKHLGREWADAVARDASEVEEILFGANSARDIARSKARGAGGIEW